jgi:hypothetical protein
LSIIVGFVLLADPLLLDRRKNSASIDEGKGVGYWLSSPGLRIEDSRVRGVEEAVSERWGTAPLADMVTRLGGDMFENVGSDVPSAESVQVPVCFDGGDFGIVVIEVGVGGANEVVGDGVTKENGENSILDSISLVLVEADEHEGVFHEVAVVQERSEEILEPFPRDSN